MKKKGNNKGFTLVEMIVVLVILAILAAILVPALLGYIDSARNKQTVVNARSVLTAAQAELSTIYGTNKIEPKAMATKDDAHNTNLLNTADIKSLGTTKVLIGTKGKYDSSVLRRNQHDAFTIDYMEYEDKTGKVFYVDGEWVDSGTAKTADNKQYYDIDLTNAK